MAKTRKLLVLVSTLLAVPAWAQDTQDRTGRETESEIIVKGKRLSDGQVATESAVGLLGERDRLDTPFSTTSVTDTLVRDLQARTLSELLRNDPSVRASFEDTLVDVVAVRGFQLGTVDATLNGLPGITPPRRFPLQTLARVDLIRGPAGLLVGNTPGGSVAGALNYVTKRADGGPVTRLTGEYVSDASFGGALDVARRFGAGEQFGIRVNAEYRDGDTPYDGAIERTGFVAANLDWRSGPFSIAVDAGYFNQRDYRTVHNFSVAAGEALPRLPSNTATLSASWDRDPTHGVYGMARARYDLGPGSYVTAAYGHSYFREQTFQALLLGTTAQGDASTLLGTFPYYVIADSADLQLHAAFRTGPLRHDVAVIGNYLGQGIAFGFNILGFGPTVSIYRPIDIPEPSLAGVDRHPPVTQRLNYASVAIADIISLADDRLQLLLGLRQQHLLDRQYDTDTLERTSRYSASKLNPAFGLVFKPSPRFSVYGNYIQALTEGQTAPVEAANAGETIPPAVSDQYELGVKADLGRISLQAAIFQIEQETAGTDPATLVFGLLGRQRNRGAEFQVFGEVARGVRVNGGFSLLDATIRDSEGGALDGKDAPGSPGAQVTFAPEIDVPHVAGLTLTGRVIYNGSAFADADNAQRVPSWTTFDLGVRYRFQTAGTPLTLRLQANNITDHNYYTVNGRPSLTRGAPRTVFASIEAQF